MPIDPSIDQQIKDLELQLEDRNLRPTRRIQLQRDLAAAYRSQGQLYSALPLLRKAYRESVSRNQRDTELSLLRELAEIEQDTGNYHEAISLLRHELHRLSSRSADYFLRLAENYCLQGELFRLEGKAETARIYYSHALTYAKCCENSKSAYKSPESLNQIRQNANSGLAKLAASN